MITLDKLKARRADLLALAARHKAGDVRVFGSVARGEADENSDIDLLVHFGPDASLFDLIGLRQDASELLSAEVDIVADDAISPYLSRRILSEAIPL